METLSVVASSEAIPMAIEPHDHELVDHHCEMEREGDPPIHYVDIMRFSMVRPAQLAPSRRILVLLHK